MKQLLIYLIVVLGLISCNFNEKKITQAEFERLYTHDSIQCINLNTDEKEAKIQTKRFDNKNKTYVLPIESVESFKASFNKLRNTLQAQHIYRSYSMSETSGSEMLMFLIPALNLILLLCILILFLFAVIDVLKNRFETATDKLIWFLVVFLIPVIGPILYFSIGRKQKLQKE